jgi:PhoPQ-activated pathogenicity-related protein
MVYIFVSKAAVRAMDATQAFLRQQGIQVPQNFVIAGLSKVKKSHNFFNKTIAYF